MASSYKITLPATNMAILELVENDHPTLSVVAEENLGSIYSSSLSELKTFLEKFGCTEAEMSRIEKLDEDNWRDLWQSTLKPTEYAKGKLRIVPQDKIKESDLIVSPGRSFGIGNHPTSSMMIEMMYKYRELIVGKSVFDFGCGSGVLALVAGRLGASIVAGCDIDIEAVEIANSNARLNEMAYCKFFLGSQLNVEFDVLLLNVLKSTAFEYFPELRKCANESALVFCSGFLEDEVNETALTLELELIDINYLEGWGAVVGRIR